jgi:hypothetical protein
MGVSTGGLRQVRRRLGVLLEDRHIQQEGGRLQVDKLEDTLVGVCKKALLVRACQGLRVHLEEGMDTQLEEVGTGIPGSRRLANGSQSVFAKCVSYALWWLTLRGRRSKRGTASGLLCRHSCAVLG